MEKCVRDGICVAMFFDHTTSTGLGLLKNHGNRLGNLFQTRNQQFRENPDFNHE